ncbi:MAG: YraN family protein [Anaerovorax sp.]
MGQGERIFMELGAWGEQTAAVELERKGYCILERNYRCKLGEIDLIAQDGATLVFIEVKTRRGLTYGLPCQSITPQKKRHLYGVAAFYLSYHKMEQKEVRIDVIELLKIENRWFIHHIKDAL